MSTLRLNAEYYFIHLAITLYEQELKIVKHWT